jgi:hypothetical protein
MTFYSGGQKLLQGETTEILEARRFQSLGLAIGSLHGGGTLLASDKRKKR